MKKLLTAALVCITPAMPALAQNETASSIIIEGSDATYETINAAAAAATDGQTILVSGEAKLTSQLLLTDKGLTIQGVSDDAKIVIESRNQIFKIEQDKDVESTASLSLINLEIDANYTANNLILLAAGALDLENIIINGFTSNAENGIIRIFGASNATIENVSFENCATPEATPYDIMFATANGSLNIKGDCDYNLCVNNKDGKINAADMTGGHVNLYMGEKVTHTLNAAIVEGTDDMSKFSLTSTASMLAPKDGNLVTIAYKPILVINTADGVKTGTGYDTFENAARNAATDAQIILNEDISYTATSAPNLGNKSVTILGNNHSLTAQNAAFTLFTPNENYGTTIKDTNLIWQRTTDESLKDKSYYIANAAKAGSYVTFDNVTFDNCSSTTTLMRSISGGALNFHDVSFKNCESGSTQLVTLNCEGSSISGSAENMSIRVNSPASNRIIATGLTQATPAIELSLNNPTTAMHDYIFIVGCNNTELFSVVNKNYELQAEGDDMKLLAMEIVTGIEEVAAEAGGEAEYFDLRGMRVSADSLTPGLYICRKGGNVSKTVIR